MEEEDGSVTGVVQSSFLNYEKVCLKEIILRANSKMKEKLEHKLSHVIVKYSGKLGHGDSYFDKDYENNFESATIDALKSPEWNNIVHVYFKA
ncbi:hypothetical protein DdX_18850 [Ditylenchus destructor]|uniref:Uncharacterized protein n=1 Tax=Ditylenchus destructor TaxID=166010 RepID=A0AAD4MIV9_9BILA|nr:hypothetical protein DdX_18850 [Ditylenchus destructor]